MAAVAMVLGRGRTTRLVVALALACLVGATVLLLPRTAVAGAATPPESLKVLMGASSIWPTGLDPAPSTTGAANAVMLDAIYGDLFSETPSGQIVPDLASGYTESNGGQTWTIHVRPGVTFSDGTPFNAQAVAFNIKRDLEPQYACACTDNFPVTSITTPNASSVVINLSEPFAPFIEGFIATPPNWIVSPTALQAQGEQSFKFKPVGAGPFTVTTDNVNSELVVTRNPHYWNKGEPKLNSITFSVIGSDASAYDAMLGGQANVDFGMDTLPIATQAKKQFNVHEVTSETEILEINTTTAPFNNLLAREAIFYATDSNALMKGFFGTTKYLDESIDGPGGLFYEQRVPGYRTFDLAKAQALVKQLGGLHVNLLSLGYESGFLGSELTTAVQAQWAKAGITSSISPVGSIASLVQDFKNNSWEAVPESTGGLDPSLAPGLAWRFAGNGPFTCCKDPQIDKLITSGLATQDVSARRQIYDQLWAYMAKESDALVLFADPAPIGGWTLVDRNVTGESLTHNNVSTIDWGSVSVS